MDSVAELQAVVFGGDARQIAVAKALTALFKKVKIFGHPEHEITLPLENVTDPLAAIAGVNAIVLPISGMNEAGLVRSYQTNQPLEFGGYMKTLPAGTIIVTGSFTKKWLMSAESLKIPVLQYAENDRIAILNSIPTAEGALQIAMEEMPITIHGSVVLVVGFGRVGITVARYFHAMGARVIVAARRPALLARAIEMNCEVVLHDAIADVASHLDLIVNTVPAMVLDVHLLSKLSKQAIIIDLASAPGGTDFDAANQLKIKALLAPGLPGVVAPKTAGAILAATLPQIISAYLENGGG